MKNYKDYQKKLIERLELAQDPNYTGKKKNADRNFNREAVITQEDMDKLKVLGRKVHDTADKYLKGKKDKPYNEMSPYEQKRYDIGLMSKEFGAQAKKELSVEELKTVAENEKLAKEGEERTAGNKKEAADRKNGGPQLN